ncbi:hypothetical protein MTO96_044035 [Rhipicephalus appendiculatus]
MAHNLFFARHATLTLALCCYDPSICESVCNDTFCETARAVYPGDYIGASFDYPLPGTALFEDVSAPWSTRATQAAHLRNPRDTFAFSEHGSSARGGMALYLFFGPQPRPQPDCDAQCALRRALLDSLSLGYARHRRGPLQREMEAAAARRHDRLSYELLVRAALMDSLCYPGGRKRR